MELDFRTFAPDHGPTTPWPLPPPTGRVSHALNIGIESAPTAASGVHSPSTACRSRVLKSRAFVERLQLDESQECAAAAAAAAADAAAAAAAAAAPAPALLLLLLLPTAGLMPGTQIGCNWLECKHWASQPMQVSLQRV